MSLASVSAVSASPARAGYSAALPVMGAAASVAGMKHSGLTQADIETIRHNLPNALKFCTRLIGKNLSLHARMLLIHLVFNECIGWCGSIRAFCDNMGVSASVIRRSLAELSANNVGLVSYVKIDGTPWLRPVMRRVLDISNRYQKLKTEEGNNHSFERISLCKDEDPAAFDMVREEDAILRQLNAKDRNRQADSYDLLYQPEQGSFTDADEEQEPPYADMYPNSKPVCLEDFADIPPCDDDFYAGTAPAIAAPVFWEQPRPAFAGNTELSEVRADAAQSAQEEYWPGLQPSAAQDVAQPAAFRPSVQPEVQNQAAPAGNSQQAAVRPQTAGIAAQSVAAVAAAATKAYFAQQAAQTAMPSDGTIQPARKAQPAASATAVASSQNMTAYNTAAQSKEETAQFAQPAARVNPAADTGASARPAVQASASAPAMVQGMNAVSATAARSASQAVPAAMPSHENAQASAPAQGNKVSGKAQSAPASKAAEPAASEESAEPYWRKSVQKALKEAADSAAARNTTASLEELAVAYEKARDASKKAHAAEQEDKSKFSAGNIASDAGHPGEQPAADGRQNSVRQGSAQGAQQRAVQTASAQVSSAKAVPADSASASKPQAVCSTAAAASGSSSAGGTVNTAAGNNNAAAGYASAQQQQTASSEPQNPDYDEEEEKRQMDRIMSMALATARGQAGKAKSAGVSSQKAQLVAAPLPRNWQEEQALFDYPECDYSEADKLDKKTGQLPILPEHIVWELRDIRAQLKTCGFRFGDLSRLIYAFYQYKSNWVMNTEQGPVRVTKENLKIACKQWVRNAERCYAAARAAGETPDAVTGQW